MQVLRASDLGQALESWDLTRPSWVDVETNGKPHWDPASAIVGVSLAQDGPEPLSVPFRMLGENAEPAILEPLLRFLHLARLGAHWLPMEVTWLSRYESRPLQWVADSYVSAALCGAPKLGLKALAREVLNRNPREFSSFGVLDCSLLHAQDPAVIAYMEDDALNARDLDKHFAPALAALRPSYDSEVAASVALARAWVRGAPVDAECATQRIFALRQELGELERKAFELHGGPFLLGGAASVGRKLEAKGVQSPLVTAGGRPSWSVEALRRLRDNPWVQPILAWREVHDASRAAEAFLRGTPVGMGAVYPSWFTLRAGGESICHSSGPDLSTVPATLRECLPAPEGQRWVSIRWAPEAEVWWLLGWLAPRFVMDGLSEWDASAQNVGVTRDEFTALVVAWVLGRGDLAFMTERVAVPPAKVEAAKLALDYVWGPLLEGLASLLRSEWVMVTGVQDRLLRAPVEGDETKRWRSFLGRLCAGQQCMALKTLMAFLASGGVGTCFIPMAGTLSFCTTRTAEEIAGIVNPFAFRHRPLNVPMFVQSGPTWGAATA